MERAIVQIDGIADVLSTLTAMSKQIALLRKSARVNADEVQSLASDLTRIRLLMNELERREVRVNGASREAAVRCLEIEGMIRMLRGDLDEIIMRVSA